MLDDELEAKFEALVDRKLTTFGVTKVEAESLATGAVQLAKDLATSHGWDVDQAIAVIRQDLNFIHPHKEGEKDATRK